jgi:DNA-binding MarR family transcriptional regulator
MMTTYRLHVSGYQVTDKMELELTCTPQVLQGEAWADVGPEGTLRIPVQELRGVETLDQLTNVVRQNAARWPPIRKQAVIARLDQIVPTSSLPANLALGDLWPQESFLSVHDQRITPSHSRGQEPMSLPPVLAPRQRQAYTYIRNRIEHDHTPTIRQLAVHLDMSISSAWRYLNVLERAGLITTERTPSGHRKPRTMKLTADEAT